MKTYLVIHTDGANQSSTRGVFSSPEKAREFVQRENPTFPSEWQIDEWEVDGERSDRVIPFSP